jgi:hypothetical protein
MTGWRRELQMDLLPANTRYIASARTLRFRRPRPPPRRLDEWNYPIAKALYLAQQQQNDQDHQYQPNTTARTITPTAAVWPGRKRANQQ